MSTPLEDFIKNADETMVQAVGLARHGAPEEQGEAQIAMFVCEDVGMDGSVLAATGRVDHNLDYLSITVHAFSKGEPVEPVLMVLDNEIVITLKNT